MNETWRSIKGFPFYQVSDCGRVRSIARRDRNGTGKTQYRIFLLKPGLFTGGYPGVVLFSPSGKRCSKTVHSLVANAFVGPCPGPVGRKIYDWQVNHKNGNKLDNRSKNLEWLSHRDNKIHAAALGLMQRGEAATKTKLKTESVLEIRRLRAKGWHLRMLARTFAVSESTISTICLRKSWRHI